SRRRATTAAFKPGGAAAPRRDAGSGRRAVSIGLAVALVGLTMLALAVLLVPLLLRRQRGDSREAYNLAVYRDQLSQTDRDVARPTPPRPLSGIARGVSSCGRPVGPSRRHRRGLGRGAGARSRRQCHAGGARGLRSRPRQPRDRAPRALLPSARAIAAGRHQGGIAGLG